MLVTPASRSRLIARLRIVARAWGALPVRTWLASSPKVTSLTWCGDSISQLSAKPSGQVGGLGLAGGEVGDRVDGDSRCPSGARVVAAPADPDRLDGVREVQVERAEAGDRSQPADLAAAVTGVAGGVQDRDSRFGSSNVTAVAGAA
jgi:hypothetical protein